MPSAVSAARRLGVAASIVGDRIVPGDVEILGDRITQVGVSPAGRTGLAVPGFVDLQVNGYGGTSFGHAGANDYPAIAAALARAGTTHFLATVISSPLGVYDLVLEAAAVAMRAQKGHDPRHHRTEGAELLGVHLEGPFLSKTRRGAHALAHLRDPDLSRLNRWLSLAPIRLVTLAPELPEAIELINTLVSREVCVSIGHTDADAPCVHRAFDLGARAHTHVWNAHGPVSARDPGSAGVALSRVDVTPCFIADLVHVSAEVLGFSLAATSDRYVVVSDVSASAGQAPGTHREGDAEVVVGDQAVWLADGTLAGSGVLLDQALRNLVSCGRPLPEAVAAVSSRPAALLGMPWIGHVRRGARADIVVLDDALAVTAVLVRGRWL